jgi:hypothetical protein
VPTIAQEAARDLVRAREDVRGDLMRARHRVSKLLLRHGHVYYGGQTWSAKHDAWLHRIRFDELGTRCAYEADLEAIEFAVARRDRLDNLIAQLAADSEFTDVTRRLCCLRGISTLTGFALAVELGDWQRFNGSSIGAYLGLVPSEHSSGQSRRQGGITQTGNGHARRLLIEAAWHHKARYTVGPVLRARWEQAPEAARVRAHVANQRLNQRWASYVRRHKKHTVANTAIARELAGWCWSLGGLEGRGGGVLAWWRCVPVAACRCRRAVDADIRGLVTAGRRAAGVVRFSEVERHERARGSQPNRGRESPRAARQGRGRAKPSLRGRLLQHGQ